jgi:hypothetical protein
MKQYLIAVGLVLGLAGSASAQIFAPQMPKASTSRADFLALSTANFTSIDTNKDGAITKDEVAAALKKQFSRNPPPDLLDKIFKPLDANSDGKATAAEVEAHTAARFDQWDKNKDGTLTPEEISDGQQALMAANQLI